jgi:hypothetical protein
MQYFVVKTKTKTKTAVTHKSEELDASKWHQNTPLKIETKSNLKRRFTLLL